MSNRLAHPIPGDITLDSILSHQFIGNHASDGVAFNQVEDWCRAPGRPHSDIVAALDHVTLMGMGIDSPMALADVPAYLAEEFD